jgi:hypothetical protein
MPVDPDRPGPVEVAGVRLRQQSGVTCGPTVVVVARALTDPGYAGRLLTGDGLAGRFAAELRRVHRATNTVWPRALGTTPWGVTAALRATGAGYRWRPAAPGPAGRARALARAAASARRGHPAAVLLGAALPRHWVLLVAAREDGWAWFEPTAGVLLHAPPGAVDRRLGFPRVVAVAAVD